MTDLYTKTVLTLIAVSLAIIAIRGTGGEKAIAQSGPVHVVVESVDKFAFRFTNPLPVTCTNCQQ